MANLHVIISGTGSISVSHNSPRVQKKQIVNWHFYCDETRISKVRIEFTHWLAGLAGPDSVYAKVTSPDQAPFFSDTPGHAHWSERDLQWSATQVKGAPARHGASIVSGVAPTLLKGPYTFKYKIEGFDAGGTRVANLDPEIITEDP